MKVRDLGEFGLIAMLDQIIRQSGAAYLKDDSHGIGIGEDAAAWGSRQPMQLGTTDMLVENVHFTLEGVNWRDLGWKSLAVNISDIAAMGGTPTCAMVSLGLPPDTEVGDIAELYRGMAEVAREFDMPVVGGDLTEAPVLIISPSVIGQTDQGKLMTRSGARSGDKIAVTGYLGASAAGLRVIRHKVDVDHEISSQLKLAHAKPHPRIKEGLKLVEAGARAAIDISDGLIADLSHICQASAVHARINSTDIPVYPAALAAFGNEALDMALCGGEDYELLVTAPKEVIEAARAHLGSVSLTVIGEVEKGLPGKVTLVDETGKEIEPEKGGWEHFGSRY